MCAQIEIIDILTEIAGIGSVGLLSPDVDLAASIMGGETVSSYLDGSGTLIMDVLVSCKGTDQKVAVNRLCEICGTLTGKNVRTYPKTDKWEIRRVTVKTPPSLKELDNSGVWFYACVISVEYFIIGHTKHQLKSV